MLQISKFFLKIRQWPTIRDELSKAFFLLSKFLLFIREQLVNLVHLSDSLLEGLLVSDKFLDISGHLLSRLLHISRFTFESVHIPRQVVKRVPLLVLDQTGKVQLIYYPLELRLKLGALRAFALLCDELINHFEAVSLAAY